ncbi:MAG: UDP-N-acetylmuramoyl-tripeptide--D-alanyl-D-alanine ligase, partial [Clostridia bacterium]|nr:UDP-N-acetylmuramoyl-tripeptide--D-alanyl-D-alanine ligase [Clostridia bacterium]
MQTKRLNKSNKTPLVLTPKAKRLIVLSCILCVLCGVVKFGYLLSLILLNFVPIIAKAINIVDFVKNKHYIRLAKQKLKNSKCKVIAITGSNGKTSVKNILQAMLETTYTCQCTPSSFNTPLGISKFINETLCPTTQFLILEYGARHLGDIKKLTKLFGADYGLVTTISAQHLETFKTINNIYKAKQQLPAFLGDGMCVFNADNIF